MRDEEKRWLQQARQGDEEAFSRIVEAYQRPVYNLCYRMLGDHTLAEDAAQVLGVVLLTVTQVTNSNLDRRIIGAIGSFLSGLHRSLGTVGFNLVMVATMAGALTVSYLISVRIFENREL